MMIEFFLEKKME